MLLKEKGCLQGWVETVSLIKYSNSVQALGQQNRLERESESGGPRGPRVLRPEASLLRMQSVEEAKWGVNRGGR